MKKILTVLAVILSSAFMLSSVSAAEEVTGNVVVHFQKWDGDYTNVGINSWGIDNSSGLSGAQGPTALGDKTKTDDFGVYWEFNDVTTNGEGTFGLQVVLFNNVGQENESPDWDSGKVANHEIANSIIQDGKTTHVYLFEGSNTRTNNEADPNGRIEYLVADPDKNGIILVYFDPSGAYEENLGMHTWGTWTGLNGEEYPGAPGWAEPLEVFVNAGKTSTGFMVKAAVLNLDPEQEEEQPGGLIYAGGDDNKKTGDIAPLNPDNEAYIENFKDAGQLNVVYVMNKGNANTTNNNVWADDAAAFAKDAFSFALMPMDVDNTGMYVGTFARNKEQVFVTTSVNVKSPYFTAETDAEREAALEEVKGWFTVKEVDGAAIPIKRVDFNVQAESVDEFVVILDGELDNTKNYVVEFDLGLEGDENLAADLELDLDREAPVITFASPSEIVGKDEDERIILIEWNKSFPANRFPTFIVTDDRDGDISHLAYVPAGEFSTINTNVVGDYKIMLRVEDQWGNVTEETFIFRVTQDLK